VTSVKISEDDCKVMLGRVAKQISGNSVLGAVVGMIRMDMFWRWRLAATASRWLRWLGSVWGVEARF
jgi:hypothetical protein